jgi:putative chitinase
MKFADLKVRENTDKNLHNIVQDFVSFAARHIGFKEPPRIKLIRDPKLATIRKSFGGYMPGGRIEINVGNRHIMDVLRTLAHEMVHYKQDMAGELKPNSGEDGSEEENEANAKAAVVMRLWGKMNPELFQHAALLAEAHPKQQMSLYKPDGITYRGKPMPTMEPDPVDDAVPLSRRPKGSYELNTDPIEGKKLIMRYWHKLKPNQQRVIKMRYWDEMTYDEISDELNLTINRIRHIEIKALSLLQSYFNNDNIENPIQNVDESLKGLAAAGLLGLGMLGGAKPVNPGVIPPEVQAQQQQAQQALAKKNKLKTLTAQPKAPGGAQKPAMAKPLSPKANLLLKTAQQQGIKGVELAQFLAQMEHESWDFKKMKEVPAGKGYFNRYDPKHNPKLAKQLGNKYAGDGTAFRGRGFIQLTGRQNYTQASYDIFRDDRLIKNPDLAAKPDIAARIAVWYWNERVKPYVRDFNDTAAVTKKINGGLNGLQDRHNNFRDYMAALGA